nr:hypothetical protein [uncultured bacterium]AQS31152.1 hypothetical protein [uncultured bacterium]
MHITGLNYFLNMVRIKDESSGRPVKVTKREPIRRESVESEVPAGASRLRRSHRGRGARRAIFTTVLVVLLLGVGWFTARAAIVGLGLDTSNSFLASLFNIKTAKLIGEEDGQVNFMLFGNPGGTDNDGPDLTDTIMLASYNTTTQYLHLFSLPRDLYVNLDGYGMTKANAVFELGDSKFSDGPGTAMKTFGDLLGVTVPYYVKIDFDGFKQVVDELGGVTVEVKKDLFDTQYPDGNKGYATVDIKVGTYTMDGEMALKYARSRQSTSDFDRARRQQQILVALRDKAKDLDLLSSPTKLLDIAEIVKDHFSSNLTSSEMSRLLQLLSDFDSTKITNKVFDDSATGGLYATKVDGAFVLKPVDDDYTKLQNTVETILNQAAPSNDQPVEDAVTTPLKVEVLNGTNVTGLAGKTAEKVKTGGFNVVKTGNNVTKGFADSVIYDGTGGTRPNAIRQLIELTGATLSTETVTLSSGAEVRLVVGESANK